MSINENLPDMRNMEIPKAPGSTGKQKGGSADTIGSESSGVAPGTVTEGGEPKAAQQNVVTRLITRGTTKKPEIDIREQGARRVAEEEAKRGGALKKAEDSPDAATGDPTKGAPTTHVKQDPLTGLNPEKEEGVTGGNAAQAKQDAHIPIEHAGPKK